jgi:hypothetical protein
MSCESLDESISAAVPDLDGAISTTRVQLAIINDETGHLLSMPCESSNQTIIVAIRHSDVSTITLIKVHLLLIDQRMELKVFIDSSKRTPLDQSIPRHVKHFSELLHDPSIIITHTSHRLVLLTQELEQQTHLVFQLSALPQGSLFLSPKFARQ